MNDPAIKKKLEALGASSASIRADRAKWTKVQKEAHISDKPKTQK